MDGADAYRKVASETSFADVYECFGDAKGGVGQRRRPGTSSC